MPTLSELQKRATLLRDHAQRLGFGMVGISKAERMDEEAKRLEWWLNKELILQNW
jgi:epoxyqueuosine reductase QueG